MKRNTDLIFRFFWKHVRQYKLIAAVMFFALIIGVIGNLLWVIIFRNFFDLLIQDQSKDIIITALFGTLFWLALVEIMDWLAWRSAEFLNCYFQPRIMSNIANECFSYIQKNSYRFFSDNFSGALVKKLGKLVRGFENIMDVLFWDMLAMSLKIIVIFGILFYVHPLLGGLMFLWSVLFLGINYWVTFYKWKYDLAASEADTRITASLSDTITNSLNIKLFSALDHESKRFADDNEHWFKVTKKAWQINASVNAWQSAFMVILEFGILFLAIYLWKQDLIGLADFFLIQAYLFELFHQLWNFGKNLRKLFENLAYSEEMIAILNTEHEIKDIKNAEEIHVHNGCVEFKNVSFAYNKDEEKVLKKLNFKVKASEKIALIGPSGGGKSTIVKLVLRLFDVNDGEILIDGQDISKVSQESLRSAVTLVPQDPILFHRTLMENIRYARRDASDREVIAAAKMAHCDEFISKFPKKYETLVGERGIKLSGGQRQRVAIARAILSNAKILILDEATSSLDSESESLIQNAFDNLIKQKTTFVIAHRLSTVMNVDRIFVLDGGKIIEEGSHAELSRKTDGLYKKLWDLQLGGYL